MLFLWALLTLVVAVCCIRSAFKLSDVMWDKIQKKARWSLYGWFMYLFGVVLALLLYVMWFMGCGITMYYFKK